jgi:Signal transduction histidine kinase
MDTAIPLGTIVNELVSNSLKYAFSNREEGEISISLYRNENHEKVYEKAYESIYEKSADLGTNGRKSERYLQYTLIVADNGPGIRKR